MINSVEDGMVPNYNRETAKELFEKAMASFEGMPPEMVMDVLVNLIVTVSVNLNVSNERLADAIATTYRVYGRSGN